jgi:chitodextrinase
LHCGAPSGGVCNETTGLGSGEHACAGCQTGFHTYAVEYDRSVSPEQMRFYLDGANYFTLNSNQIDATTWNNATHHGMFMILNVAMGGGFPAAFGGGPTAATQSGVPMLVDYVAVYQSGGGTTTPPTTTPTTTPPTGGGGCTGLSAWSAAAVYVGGNSVSYSAHKYTAKWWTQNETPGQADVWADNGACSGGGTTTAPTTAPTTVKPTTQPPTTQPPAGATSWAAYTAYTVGQTVTYAGVSYRCLQSHTSLPGWEPPNVPALWQRI